MKMIPTQRADGLGYEAARGWDKDSEPVPRAWDQRGDVLPVRVEAWRAGGERERAAEGLGRREQPAGCCRGGGEHAWRDLHGPATRLNAGLGRVLRVGLVHYCVRLVGDQLSECTERPGAPTFAQARGSRRDIVAHKPHLVPLSLDENSGQGTTLA